MYKNTAYSSQCELNIYFFLSYKSDLGKSSEKFSLFCCLINMNDRQQEY